MVRRLTSVRSGQLGHSFDLHVAVTSYQGPVAFVGSFLRLAHRFSAGKVLDPSALAATWREWPLLSAGRLKIQADIPEAETLISELQDYQIQYTAAGNLTANARQGQHDDVVLAAALAIWRLSGGGMAGWGAFEFARKQAFSVLPRQPERLVIGLDLGKRRDFSALVVARRIFLYDHELGSLPDGPLQPMGGAIIEEPHPYHPEGTAAAPASDDPQFRHEVDQAGKALLRDEFGQHYRGPLRATPYGSEPVNGPAIKPVYAIGSFEYQQQQRSS